MAAARAGGDLTALTALARAIRHAGPLEWEPLRAALALDGTAEGTRLRRLLWWDYRDLLFVEEEGLRRLLAEAPKAERRAAGAGGEAGVRERVRRLTGRPPTADPPDGPALRERLLRRAMAAVEEGRLAMELPGLRSPHSIGSGTGAPPPLPTACLAEGCPLWRGTGCALATLGAVLRGDAIPPAEAWEALAAPLWEADEAVAGAALAAMPEAVRLRLVSAWLAPPALPCEEVRGVTGRRGKGARSLPEQGEAADRAVPIDAWEALLAGLHLPGAPPPDPAREARHEQVAERLQWLSWEERRRLWRALGRRDGALQREIGPFGWVGVAEVGQLPAEAIEAWLRESPVERLAVALGGQAGAAFGAHLLPHLIPAARAMVEEEAERRARAATAHNAADARQALLRTFRALARRGEAGESGWVEELYADLDLRRLEAAPDERWAGWLEEAPSGELLLLLTRPRATGLRERLYRLMARRSPRAAGMLREDVEQGRLRCGYEEIVAARERLRRWFGG